VPDIPAGECPDFEVRVSPRARRVRLRVLPGRPVIVTIPRGVSRRVAEDAVRDAALWVARARARVEGEAAKAAARRAEPLPTVIPLPGVGLRYVVEKRSGKGAGVRAGEHAGRVILSGSVEDTEACREALRRWVRRVGSSELKAMARDLSTRTGLVPEDLKVTWPRARWGSCSAKGVVRLSVDLVFVPPELSRAVVLHELVHLRVLDHSPRFWAELSRFDPDCREHRKDLGRARDHIPGWALPDGE
jgi:predicted metal-dependent hydrolase